MICEQEGTDGSTGLSKGEFASAKASGDFDKVFSKGGILAEAGFYSGTGVEDGGMGFSEGIGDFGERGLGQSAAKVHGDLSGMGDGLWAALAGHIGHSNIVVFCHGLLNSFQGQGLVRFFFQKIAQEFFKFSLGGNCSIERNIGDDPREGAFQRADIRLDSGSNELQDRFWKLDGCPFLFIPEDGETGFEIRRLEFGDQTPFESGDESLFEPLDLVRRPIARHHNLFMGVEEGVECMKEFLLKAFLSGEKVNIVDQEQVHTAVTLSELKRLIGLKRINEFVDEGFGRDVANAGRSSMGEDIMTDGLHEVGFTEARVAVDKEGVISFGGRLSHGHACGVSKTVGGAHDECIKLELFVESAGRRAMRSRGGSWTGFFPGF